MLLFLLPTIYGCNSNAKHIEAEGKSKYWNANITYELKTEKHGGKKEKILYNTGEIVYLKDNPPKEIEFEYIYPNDFPSSSSGSSEHFEEGISEFRIAGGGGSINKGNNYENLKEKIEEAHLLVKWKINNEVHEEEIQLNVIQ